jgi:hypothetical protein
MPRAKTTTKAKRKPAARVAKPVARAAKAVKAKPARKTRRPNKAKITLETVVATLEKLLDFNKAALSDVIMSRLRAGTPVATIKEEHSAVLSMLNIELPEPKPVVEVKPVEVKEMPIPTDISPVFEIPSNDLVL